MLPSRSAAFVDLDNTLLHGSSLYFLGRGMHARGIVSTRDVARGAWQQLLFRLVGERRSDMEAVRDRSLALGAGVEVAPLVELGSDIYEQSLAPRILAGPLALVQAHLDRGEDVYLVTTAPIELARLVAARLGFTGALGTVSEVADGRWTGRLVGELLHGAAKADAVRVLAADAGYDLADCAAYSDSVNDLPLLSAVGKPHAVNPDRRLRAVAVDRGWAVHEFRLRRRSRTLAAVTAPPAVAAAAGGVVLLLRRRGAPAVPVPVGRALAATAAARTGYRHAVSAAAARALQQLSAVSRRPRSSPPRHALTGLPGLRSAGPVRRATDVPTRLGEAAARALPLVASRRS